MRPSPDVVARFWELFRGRDDIRGTLRGGFKNEPVTKEVVAGHLAGQGRSLGVYPLDKEGRCHWAAADIDTGRLEDATRLRAALAALGVNSGVHIEPSRSKGYHVWLFVDPPAFACDLRRILRAALAEAGLDPQTEIFPKQDRLTEETPVGNYVNVPYYNCRNANGRRVVLDPVRLEPLSLEEFLESATQFPTDSLELVLAELPPEPVGTDRNPPGWLDELLAQRVPTGRRRPTLARLAGAWRTRGIGKEAAIQMAIAWAAKAFEEHLSEEEIARHVGGVYDRYGVVESATLVVDTGTTAERPLAAPPLPPPAFPEAAWQHPFDLYREAAGSSTEAADEHHFAAFRAVAGAYFGRRVSVHYGRTQYPGDYVLLIGPTHDKKTTAQRRALDFLATLAPRVGTVASLHSAEGLIEWMAKLDMSPQELARFIDWMGNTKGEAWEPLEPEHRRGLVSIEEFAALLQKARMEGSSQLITTITQLYDMPAVLEPPLRTRRIVAEAPTLSILAASTSQWIVQNLRSSDILGGFGNRFTYWTGLAKEPMPWPAAADKKALRTVAAAVEEAFGRWQRGTEFSLTAGARTAWGAFYTRWVKQAREEGDSPTSAMESRIPEHAVKLALLYAALVNEQPEIDEGQIDAAVQVAGYLRESTRFAFGDQLDTGESPTVKLENRILAVLDRESVTKRELQQKSKQRRSSAIDFNRVYEGLVKARIIRENSETGKVEKL